MQHTLVVIEDDKDLNEFLKEALVEKGYQVYTAFTGTSGLDLVEKTHPELVLLDLNLPDIDGETVCKEIKKKDEAIKVIMLTAKDTPKDLAHGFAMGADDYMGKPFVLDELYARIAARLRATTEQNDAIELVDLKMNLLTHEVFRKQKKIKLSAQEFKLLHFLMSNPNRVLTRDVILTRIWGVATDVETRVVDVYIGYLRKKIDHDFSLKLIQSIRGFGYMLKIPKTDPLVSLSSPKKI